jgi:DNA polymerase-3 subunit alpha
MLGDADRPRNYSGQQYLKSPEEMRKLFQDIPEALQNSAQIAMRCNLELELGRTFLPAFPIPEGQTIEQFLTSEATTGLEKNLRRRVSLVNAADGGPEIFAAPYHKRLADEIAVICEMGFAGYFLIVSEFIRWAKEQEIPVGSILSGNRIGRLALTNTPLFALSMERMNFLKCR